MASCKDCLHVEVCISYVREAYKRAHIASPDLNSLRFLRCDDCEHFKDRSRFVELPTARKIKHTPDFEKIRYFHKLGLGKGMNERSVFWTCSNCGMWASLAHKFCPNCGAKFEAKQALEDCENSV